ncbi:MAG TPA: hypothetical protein VGL97_18345 [Bryobacteraceae bacterium]|jgi:hypothetical protein
MANVQPNEYVLKGGNIAVSYVTNGFQNQPTLAYNDGQQTKSFRGTEIRLLKTEIGSLVSVTTFLAIDTGSTSFSALLPVIELADRTQTQNFKTAGILTNRKGPESFPGTGVRESYELIHMHGTARVVVVPLAAGSPAGTKR